MTLSWLARQNAHPPKATYIPLSASEAEAALRACTQQIRETTEEICSFVWLKVLGGERGEKNSRKTQRKPNVS
jgi:hypothetical protein